MSVPISDVKAFITAQLRADCEPVPPKTSTSEQVHLSVWLTRGKRRPIGVELGHKEVANLWVLSMHAPTSPPATVAIAKKTWNGSGWTDKDPNPAKKGRDGANSNLRPFEVFNTRPITRLGIQSIEDARAILDHLFS